MVEGDGGVSPYSGLHLREPYQKPEFSLTDSTGAHTIDSRQYAGFEREVGSSADRRHHVRWWRVDAEDVDGRPLWIGDATFDRGVGVSHRTGQIPRCFATKPNFTATPSRSKPRWVQPVGATAWASVAAGVL